MRERSWEEMATELARMSRTLLAQESVQGTLDQIVRHAVGLVDGCDDAGVLVLEDRTRVRSLAASSDLVRTSDQQQEEVGEGPCFDAAREQQEVFRIADVGGSEPRWPHYAPRARALGIGSMMGFLLFTEEGSLGALNMYSSKPAAFTTRSENTGWVLASHAAVAFSSARSSHQMHTAMETRNLIGEALGIVMERFKITDEQAFEVLKKSSQDHNIKLRNIASTITRTGELPGAS